MGRTAVRPVGIIANPLAGKDIRRLAAYGAPSDNLGKVRLLVRLLMGLREAGVRQVLYMPDPAGLVMAAWHDLRAGDRAGLELVPLPAAATGAPEDTTAAAAAMAAAGAGCTVILGGDGTNRLAALGCGETPLLPVSTGTNNAFPFLVEPTVAGLAAGLVAARRAPPGALRRAQALTVRFGTVETLAVVEVAWLAGNHTGARAIWDVAPLRELVVTQGLPYSLGLSAIAGVACPVPRWEPRGAHLRIGPGGRPVRAAVAPGTFATVPVAAARTLAMGHTVLLPSGPGVLALDGERLFVLSPGQPAAVTLVEGPVVVDPWGALENGCA